VLKEVLFGIGGFTAGVLLAPASGGDTRSALASILAEAMEAAGDRFDVAQETARRTARKAGDFAETAADIAQQQYGRARKHGRRAAKAAREYSESAREAVEETYSKARDRAADVLPIERSRPSTGNVIAKFAIGAGVGFGLALLFAPKRGAELRDDIADAAQSFADDIACAAQSFAGGMRKGYREQRAAAGAGAWTGTTGPSPDYT